MLHDLTNRVKAKILNALGTVINPATDEKLDELKTLLDNIDKNTDTLEVKAENINLNTDTLESKIESTNTRIGEIQTTPTQYTVLGRLKDLWDKLNDLFTNGVARIKLWDGTNQAGIDSANALYVAGKSATGVVPSSNPVYISGIDINGIKRGVRTDANGRIQVVMPTASALLNIPVQLIFQNTHTSVNQFEWQEVLSYTVPTGYDFNCISFDASSDVANEKAKAIFKATFGSFVGSTNTFTDGESWSLPRFAGKLYLYVTTQIGSGGNDVINITYTNQYGVTGRIGTVTITKNSLVGTRLEVALQTGDFGVIDVTNITHSQTGQQGDFTLEGNLALFHETLTTVKVQYSSPAPPLNAIVVPEGGKIYLQYWSSSAVSSSRRINLTGSLAPRQ